MVCMKMRQKLRDKFSPLSYLQKRVRTAVYKYNIFVKLYISAAWRVSPAALPVHFACRAIAAIDGDTSRVACAYKRYF